MSKPVFFRSPRIGSRRAAPQMSDSSRGAESGTKGASGWSQAGGHRTGLGAGARSAPEARSRCWAGSPRRGGLRGARRVRAAPRVRRPSLPEAAGGRDDAAAHGRRRRRREPVARPAPPHASGAADSSLRVPHSLATPIPAEPRPSVHVLFPVVTVQGPLPAALSTAEGFSRPGNQLSSLAFHSVNTVMRLVTE